MIEASSRAASITFDGHTVTIHRTRGGYHPVGSRAIPIGQISGIQFKPSALLTAGWIKFLVPGTTERVRKPGAMVREDALRDPNVVPFYSRNQDAFVELKEALERAIAHQASAGSGILSPADELAKLGLLVQQGLLTAEEFETAKLRLLG
jgi:hypothetical protein